MSTQQISLQAEERTVLGKQVKHLRSEGLVPGTVYERGKPSVSISVPAKAAVKTLHQAGKHHPVNLTIGEKDKRLTMIKDVDVEPVKGRIRHIAFHAVNKNEKVTAEIPVVLEGTPPAELANLMVLRGLDHVEVEAIPSKLPDELSVDAALLKEIGDQATVEDLKAPDGVEIMTEPEQVLFRVEEPRSAAAEAAEEAAETTEAGTAEESAAAGDAAGSSEA